jgi:hypothetical protein
VREWLGTWRGKKAYALFSVRDPQPFLRDIWRVLRTLTSKTERRKRGFAIAAADQPSRDLT